MLYREQKSGRRRKVGEGRFMYSQRPRGEHKDQRAKKGRAKAVSGGLTGEGRGGGRTGCTEGVHCCCTQVVRTLSTEYGGQKWCGMTEWVARLSGLSGAAGTAPADALPVSRCPVFVLISRQPVHPLQVPFSLSDRSPRKGVRTGATGTGGGRTASFIYQHRHLAHARRGSANTRNAIRQALFHHGRRSNKTTKTMLLVRRPQYQYRS